MSRFAVFRRLWLPRAIQICLPTLTSEAIVLLKAVPLVSTIAVMDLLGAANMVRDMTYLVYEALACVVCGHRCLAPGVCKCNVDFC